MLRSSSGASGWTLCQPAPRRALMDSLFFPSRCRQNVCRQLLEALLDPPAPPPAWHARPTPTKKAPQAGAVHACECLPLRLTLSFPSPLVRTEVPSSPISIPSQQSWRPQLSTRCERPNFHVSTTSSTPLRLRCSHTQTHPHANPCLSFVVCLEASYPRSSISEVLTHARTRENL